jgi:cell division protein ZapA (FtsZ GTPase activity inhibitor)
MGEQSMRVNIAGSEFTLKVDQSESEIVLNAARLINEKISELSKAYSVNDKKDILSMVALLLVSQQLKSIKDQESELKNLQGILDELNQMIKNHQVKISQ